MSHLGVKKCSDMVSRRFLDATVSMLQKEIDELKAELAKERAVVDIYAMLRNSKEYHDFLKEDLGVNEGEHSLIRYGKIARQRQRERSE